MLYRIGGVSVFKNLYVYKPHKTIFSMVTIVNAGVY